MADGTKIEWTDATVNYVNGCTLVSEGCRNCYAARLAATRLRHHPTRAGLATINRDGVAKFTGEIRLNEAALLDPLRWRRPRRIFWNAHGDLFHESVSDEAIDRQFAVMALTRQHIHQVLTKRPARMREWFAPRRSCRPRADIIACEVARLRGIPDLNRVQPHWPRPNVWLGTSVEDQATADERVPHLLETPAAVRFVSAEPLLGPIDLQPLMKLDWVIVGGESGPGARVWPGFEDAARSLRDQCASAGVAFFMKQMAGARKSAMPPIPADLMIREMPHAR